MRPRKTPWLSVSAFIADSAMLNPEAVWSMASTLIDAPLNVSCHQVPHSAEPKPEMA